MLSETAGKYILAASPGEAPSRLDSRQTTKLPTVLMAAAVAAHDNTPEAVTKVLPVTSPLLPESTPPLIIIIIFFPRGCFQKYCLDVADFLPLFIRT